MTSEAAPAPEGPRPTGPARRFYLWVALGLVLLSIGAIWIAAQADPSETISAVDVNKLRVGPPAPELHAKGWLNSPALSPGELAGKVVVYDFWTYSCVNCVRTLPYLRAWHERYRKDGLVIVGVHSPEFDFEKDHANVESAVARLKVTWPPASSHCSRPISASSPGRRSRPATPPGPCPPRCCSCWASPSSSPLWGPPPGCSARP